MPPAPPRGLATLLDFLRSEAAGGLALIAAALVALIWSNAPVAPAYRQLLGLQLPLGLSLLGWVNDGLMTVFFLAVALEIRREMTEGQLASPRRAAAPLLAALGGMAVPAAFYALANAGHPASLRGWAVPVATDIAFALAALRVLGRRAPAGLKVFLTALAIIDDLGAIAIIALFYGGRLNPVLLAAAAGIWAAAFALGRTRTNRLAPFLILGAALWLCVLRSGLHPTLAGVSLAFAVPMRAQGPSPAHRLETALNPVVTWLILPAFGLANAGLHFDSLPAGVLAHPVVLGTLLGLALGKPIGVFGTIAAAVRLGIAKLPAGLGWAELGGGAILCGIGFTMSLFIGDLSFRGTPLEPEAKLAIFAASAASALLGTLWLLAVGRPKRSLP